MNNMSTSLKEIVSQVTLLKDDGANLVQSLNKGNLLGLSDGSLHADKTNGSYAFSLQDQYTNKERIIGSRKVPRSNNMLSLTTEMYEVIGTLSVLYFLCIHHNIQEMSVGM